MRIIWNNNENAFQAEFAQGDLWRSDMATAKAAGFCTEGPPQWVWLAHKAATLANLRANRPTSGLQITEQALQKFIELRQAEETAVADSKAVSSDIEIPTPNGLSFLPYQKAGIKYALKKFGVI